MGRNADEIRKFDQTGHVVNEHTNTNTEFSGSAVPTDEVERATVQGQQDIEKPKSMRDQKDAGGATAPPQQHNVYNEMNNSAPPTTQANYVPNSNHMYTPKEWVLATKVNPPPPEDR
eukprot:UN05383